MEIFVSLFLIMSALAIGAMSPGPSFVIVAKMAIGNSRRDGLAAALGMGVGGLLFAVLSLLGLHAVLVNVPTLYFLLKVLGGCYLIYMGIRIYQTATHTVVIDQEPSVHKHSLGKSFLTGLVTQISNPKTAIVYSSIFAALLPREFPGIVYILLPLLVFCMELGWYSLVAFALSSPAPRAVYLRSKTTVDRLTAGILGTVGVRLIYNAGTNQV